MGALGRAVSFWHDSGGRSICPAGYYPGPRRLLPSAAPLTRGVRDSIFRLLFRWPVSGYQGPYETGSRSSSSESGYLGSITSRLRRDPSIVYAGQTSLFAQCPAIAIAIK